MYKHFHNRKGVLAPCPAMWEALKEGEGLEEILTDFYTRVYADPVLVSFFNRITIERSIEKQFSFLRSIFTGEKCYFGDHPKGAHNWMVISNELFDHRENLMEGCLLDYGLPEALIKKWRDIEEVFRSVIVKDTPKDIVCGNIRKPSEGYIMEVVEVDTLCDACGDEVNAKQEVICHIRTGEVFCGQCKNKNKLKLYKKVDATGYVAINS